MAVRKIHGEVVTDEHIEVWADEAEAGFDVPTLRRRGRPTVGEGPTVTITVRLDKAMLDAMMEHAREVGVPNQSEAVRAAVRAWSSA